MDAELKALWIEALTSGKYKQGKRTLKSDSGNFCCLGVLCDIQGVDWESTYGPSSFPYAEKSFPDPDHSAGLDMETQLEVLAGKNDSGDSFFEIAGWIEANIPAEA